MQLEMKVWLQLLQQLQQRLILMLKLPPFRGEAQAVEILASGQHSVAFGVHPDTGRPFQWGDGGRGPCSGLGEAAARGIGRLPISMSRPPAPMRMMSAPLSERPAIKRRSTQSSPLSLGERAQPGMPSTGTTP